MVGVQGAAVARGSVRWGPFPWGGNGMTDETVVDVLAIGGGNGMTDETVVDVLAIGGGRDDG